MKNVTAKQITTKLATQPFVDGERAVHVALHPGDTTWDPTSTKRLLHGPADLRYREHQDGGYSVTEREHGTSTITT